MWLTRHGDAGILRLLAGCSRLEVCGIIPIMPYKDRKNLYAAQKRHRVKVRTQLFAFLSTKECVDCGEKDPVVLDFDHNGLERKFKTVAKMLSGHYSWESVQREIRKCEIRCANCHRRKTYLQLRCWGKTKPS